MAEVLSLLESLEKRESVDSVEGLSNYVDWLRRSVALHPVGNEARPLRVSDLFCGPGGFSFGFKEGLRDSGIAAVSELAVDFDPAAIETYRINNNPAYVRRVDLAESFILPLAEVEEAILNEARPKLIDKRLSSSLRRTEVLLASPPCKGFSNLNNQTRRDDERNELSLAAASIAITCEVPTFLMENVPEIRSDKGKVLKRTLDLFTANGYSVDFRVYTASSFGIPQARRRLILIASRKVDPSAILLEMEKRQAPSPYPSDVLALPHLSGGEAPHMVEAANLSEENWRRVNYLFDNDIYDLPNEVRPDCHKEEHTYPSIYGRMYPDRPAGTLTSGFLSPGRGRFVHPIERRGLHLRDGARLQSFPDSYDFPAHHGRTITARMLGDAVPPLLSYNLAVAFASLANDAF